ncbi:MAG TPA: ABC transporter ATP-binding protein, partial [Gammaproteobacteria bacterium]|nr:ABC transporter ATP-binding protein [Gammaproteobacteria bacterium]
HYLEEADALADRIVVVNHGRVIAEGSPAEIKARAALVRIRCSTHLSIAQVESLAAVKAVRADGARLEITTVSPEEVLREMLWQDPELTDLEVTGARLEDAFVELTREEEIAA